MKVMFTELQSGPLPFIDDVLTRPTSRRILGSRLTLEMERELMFIMNQVRMGSQTRYQRWFASRFLALPDTDSLLPDLVRS